MTDTTTIDNFENAADEHWAQRLQSADDETLGSAGPSADVMAESRVQQFGSRILSGKALLDLPSPLPMVGDWLDRGMLASMPGKYGSLKSFSLMYLGMSVVTGEPWFGQPVHHQGVVLYIAAEGAYTMSDRLKGWRERTGQEVPDSFRVYPHRVDLLDPAELEAFKAYVAQTRPVLIIGDTLSKLMSGDENSKESMAKVYNALDDLREAAGGATIIVAHHTGHGVVGRGRGSSSFEDDIDVVIALHGQAKDGPVKVVSEKQKARKDPAPFWIDLAETDNRLPIVEVTAAPPPDNVDGLTQIKSLILAMITKYPEQLTRADLERKDSKGWIDAPQKRVREAVKLLVGESRIDDAYKCPDDDRQKRDLLILANQGRR